MNCNIISPFGPLGVDEFSIRKGHKYMTIFINLETGEIIHAVEGKSIGYAKKALITLARVHLS
ncbi:MAG: transposase [Parachlamydiaceae bacterium]|nr:transposase [Parachlamydiaceae bacterium]